MKSVPVVLVCGPQQFSEYEAERMFEILDRLRTDADLCKVLVHGSSRIFRFAYIWGTKEANRGISVSECQEDWDSHETPNLLIAFPGDSAVDRIICQAKKSEIRVWLIGDDGE